MSGIHKTGSILTGLVLLVVLVIGLSTLFRSIVANPAVRNDQGVSPSEEPYRPLFLAQPPIRRSWC
jgi:hypothetical protein